MDSHAVRSPRTLLVGALAVSMLVAGCVRSGGQATPAPTPSPSPAPSGSVPAGFYMRAWQTQALAPQYTFGWLPIATIADGYFIDGNVAVPAIYPGPLWIGPSALPISQKGIDAIVAEARRLGMLGSTTDFTDEIMPGSVVGHVQIVVDGKIYDLIGDPDRLVRCRCIPSPGTPAAFAAFWQELTQMATWLAEDLGPSRPYQPERLAVLVVPPTEATNDINPGEAAWPLAAPFAEFGVEFGSTMRCGVVTGVDLALLAPVVKESNQLTRFVDSEGVARSLQVRVLVPGESSPCP
jgi:hypothetical protein